MPKETDPDKLAELVRVLRDKCAVRFSNRAHKGHPLNAEPDEIGLDKLFPPKVPIAEKQRLFLLALADSVENGPAKVSRLEREYGIEYEFHEFIASWPIREYAGMKLYVKANWLDVDPKDPEIEIHKIARDNS